MQYHCLVINGPAHKTLNQQHDETIDESVDDHPV